MTIEVRVEPVLPGSSMPSEFLKAERGIAVTTEESAIKMARSLREGFLSYTHQYRGPYPFGVWAVWVVPVPTANECGEVAP
jgi:hypothetical protein